MNVNRAFSIFGGVCGKSCFVYVYVNINLSPDHGLGMIAGQVYSGPKIIILKRNFHQDKIFLFLTGTFLPLNTCFWGSFVLILTKIMFAFILARLL